MNNEQLDQKIKIHFDRYTKEAGKVKEETWNNISNELFPNHRRSRRWKIGGFIAGFSAAAVIAILIFGLMTEPGRAMFHNLRDMFIEEKQENIEIEGMEEETNVQLEANEELRYIIYIDEERYKMVEGETTDRIETIEPLPEQYPEVYMEITRLENTTTEAVIADIKKTIIEDPEMELAREERVTTPIEAEVVQGMGLEYTNEAGKTGHQWDTPVHRYYVTDTDEGQVFVIKQVYFMEAAEGHGARFHYMLESFQVVK